MPEGSQIQVSLRCRPLSSTEKSSGASRVVKVSGNQVSLTNSQDSKNEIYKDVTEPLLRRALDGYNVSLIVFGQNGSGKSHTLSGSIDDPGVVTKASETLFNVIEESTKEYFVVISYAEIADDRVHDLINPSGIDLNVRQHPQLGLYVDDLAEVVVESQEDIMRLHDQGCRIRNLVSNANEANRTSTIFSIVVEQRSKDSPQLKSTRSIISFIELAGSNHTSKSEEAPFVTQSLNSLEQVVSSLKQTGKTVPYADSKLTQLLQDSFGGNGFSSFIGHVSPSDAEYSETLATLQFSTSVKNVHNTPKRNEFDHTLVIKGLRDEIADLRKKLSSAGNTVDVPNNDDVTRMEGLIKDLQLAKMQSWEEKQRISEMFLEERKHHLSSKGILDWVLESQKKGSKDIQSKLASLQKEKEQLMIDYKEKRYLVDGLKDKLQAMITEYTKLNEAGQGNSKEGKEMVNSIHGMKEMLKQENDHLKKLKQTLKEVQDKQKVEKEEARNQTAALKGNFELRFKLEAENREQMEKENRATLAEEMDRIKLEIDNEKAELNKKKEETKEVPVDELIRVEGELLDVKAEKSAMAVKLRSIESEKKQLQTDVDEMYKRQKEELEIQQLQHFQTFRHYREAFEEQKAMLEQRYRTLLEDSIQDAVYLSSRNQELLDENQAFKQEIAELKDKLSMVSGRPNSPD